MDSDSKKIIIPRIFGGLGNQLFIYATARRLALVNNAELVIDDISGFKYDKEYKREYQLDHFKIKCRKATSIERLEPFSRLRRFLLRNWNGYKPFFKRNYIQEKGTPFDPLLLDFKIKEKTYLEGYWQSEAYFKDIEDVIRDDLQIIPPTDDKNQLFAKTISNKNSIAVHVRFFDEPENTNLNKVMISYYRDAIKKMEEEFLDTHYFIFSDRIEEANTLLEMIHDKMTIISHNQGEINAYADFWLMSTCNHFIIANSTFSWWASWLNNSPNKLILHPNSQQTYYQLSY